MTYQNYKHYKLPITMNPLEYGKLILKIDELNLFILQLPKTNNILILTQKGLTNHIKLYKEGEFRFNYSDFKLSHNTFTRTISSTRFTFRDRKLIEAAEIVLLILAIVLVFFFIIFNESNIALSLPLIFKRDFSKNYYRNSWNSIYFTIDNQIFSTELLEGYYNKFWKIVSPKIEDGCHIFILLKFQFEDNNVHTIGKLIKIDHNNYKSFNDQIINYMENMGDYYNQSPFKRIIFQYGFKKGEISEKKSKSEVNLINFKDMKLPISIDPIDYGQIIETIALEDHKIYIIHDNLGRTIIFKEFEKENFITYNNKSIKILEFKDTKYSEGKFLRILGKRKILFENGKKLIDRLTLDTPFISKLKKDKIENNNFITLDIETYGDQDLIPYLISFYDGSQSFSFYLADYSNIESMMKATFKALFIRKYRNYPVYVHNLTKFDIYFLLKYLVKYVQIDPLIHNGRIIQLNLNYGPDLQYNMCLKDSYLILLSSLENLGINYKIINTMSITNITYLQDIIPHKYFVFSEYDYTIFYFSDSLDIKLFLRELQIDKVYVVTFELIISELIDNDNPPVITLSKPIVVTRNSNPLIIAKFINNQIVQADNNFNLDYELLINMRNAGKTVPYIIVKYATINLF
jgi:hypothetical protein